MDKFELVTGRPGRFCQAQTPKLPEVRHFLWLGSWLLSRRARGRVLQTPKLPEVRHFFSVDYRPELGHRARGRVLRSEEWQKSAIFILPGVLTNADAMDI